MAIKFNNVTLEKHRELADSIKDALVVEGTTAKEAESHSAYYANLPDGMTQKEVEALAKYNSRFVTAAHVAAGEIAAEVFSNDKQANEFNANIGFFGKTDNLEFTVNRSKTYQNHLAEKEEDREVTKHLVMKMTATSQSVKGYGTKSIREAMSEEFRDMFKK